jgi:endonuclease-3
MRDSDIHHIVRILRREVKRWKVPALAHYSETPYRTLISCVLSLRTQDRTTVAASDRLFAVADTPESMLRLRASRIEKLIYPVSFYRVKAETIRKISRKILDDFGGDVPHTVEELVTLPGVGRKTANIVVTLGFGKPGIAVDIHVHRISNRLGYVKTKDADATERALREKLPKRYWIEFNDLLVTYGQNLCKPVSPFCSQCRIRKYCDRVGVGRSR